MTDLKDYLDKEPTYFPQLISDEADRHKANGHKVEAYCWGTKGGVFKFWFECDCGWKRVNKIK